MTLKSQFKCGPANYLMWFEFSMIIQCRLVCVTLAEVFNTVNIVNWLKYFISLQRLQVKREEPSIAAKVQKVTVNCFNNLRIKRKLVDCTVMAKFIVSIHWFNTEIGTAKINHALWGEKLENEKSKLSH